jgi:hypothetical protein
VYVLKTECPLKKPGLQVALKSGDGWTGPDVHWQRIPQLWSSIRKIININLY